MDKGWAGTRSAIWARTWVWLLNSAMTTAGSLGFGQAFCGVFFLEKHLPLQIAPLHIVAIDQRQRTNPGARQKPGDGCSGRSAANDGDMGGQELLLALLPDA